MRRYWNAVKNWRSLVFEQYHQFATPSSPPGMPTWSCDLEANCITVLWPRVYACPDAAKWVTPVSGELAKLVQVTPHDLPQENVRAVRFLVRHRGQTHAAVLDYGDYPDEIDHSVLDQALVYFKMQYRATGYGDERVIPGGYVTASDQIYHYLPTLRRDRDRKPELFDVYGRFGLRFAGDVRRRTVELLTNQNNFRYEGGLKLVRYSRFLQQVARAKICIDLPGNGDFCYRLVDYFAIGSCVLAAPHGTRFPIPLVNREHLVYFAPDGSDLLELCDYYLSHPDERRRLIENSRNYFDRYLHRSQLASYYLHEIVKRLPR